MAVTGVMVYVCGGVGGGDKTGQSHKARVRSRGGSGQCINMEVKENEH